MAKMRRLISVAAGGCLLAGLSGCATTAANIDSAAELARESGRESGNPAATVVFGRFELLRNGHDVAFGDGIFASSATLNLAAAGDAQPIVGRIGRDGEFAWALKPGTTG